MSDKTYKYTHLLIHSDSQIEHILRKQGKRSVEIHAILQNIRGHKRAKKAERARKQMLNSLWRMVIDPLANEQRIVYNMSRYAKNGYALPERTEAIQAYDAVLQKLKAKLRRVHSAYELTPKQEAKRQNDKANRVVVTNDGHHWVDWVPAHIKDAIREAFANIPRNFRAKLKVPFERKITVNMNSRLRAMHQTTLRREREAAIAELLIQKPRDGEEISDGYLEAKAYVDRIDAALDRLDSMQPTEPVPLTWHDLVDEDAHEIRVSLTR